MQGLIDEAGAYRRGGVGVVAGEQMLHMAPPANRVPALMDNLLRWLSTSEAHPLVASSVFHYEFMYRMYGMRRRHGCRGAAEFIHPFTDGNGRMGRLWQTVILSRWNPLFADIPVESLVHEHHGGVL